MGFTGQRADDARGAVGLQGDTSIASIQSGQDAVRREVHQVDDARHVQFAGHMLHFDPAIRRRGTLLLERVSALAAEGFQARCSRTLATGSKCLPVQWFCREVDGGGDHAFCIARIDECNAVAEGDPLAGILGNRLGER